MRQRIVHGATIETATPHEVAQIVGRPEEITRIREPSAGALGAAGTVTFDVYKVPAGYEFSARRITLYTDPNADPSTAPTLLNAAGKFIRYLRSGILIEYGQPQYGANIQVPGVQTWGDQQGPYLRNSEVFQVHAVGLPANVNLMCVLEGLLRRPREPGADSQ